MKKSEKIEIRISLEEKEALAQLAESEGRSISELVRELAKKYAQLNMSRPLTRMSRWHMAGLILCGLGLGVGSTMSFLNQDQDRLYGQFMVHGVIDDHGFGFGIESALDSVETVNLGEGQGAYTIKVHVTEGDDKTRLAAISICQQQNAETCKEAAQADISMGQGNSPSVWQAKTQSGDPLFLVMQPVSS